MPNCENCYHYEVCEFNLSHQGIDLTSIVLASKYDNSADSCPYFKDKSLIVELPCKVGDTLYVIIDESKKFGGAYIKQEKAVEISTEGRIWTDDCYYDSDDVGKIIFFTREEAEKALEERKKMR